MVEIFPFKLRNINFCFVYKFDLPLFVYSKLSDVLKKILAAEVVGSQIYSGNGEINIKLSRKLHLFFIILWDKFRQVLQTKNSSKFISLHKESTRSDWLIRGIYLPVGYNQTEKKKLKTLFILEGLELIRLLA